MEAEKNFNLTFFFGSLEMSNLPHHDCSVDCTLDCICGEENSSGSEDDVVFSHRSVDYIVYPKILTAFTLPLSGHVEHLSALDCLKLICTGFYLWKHYNDT